MKTNVYVDGFNLYYGCLSRSPYKWLDIDTLCRTEFPSNVINRIRYFTANVTARPTKPDQPINQQTYIRALKTIPHVSVHLGHFLSSGLRMPLEEPIPGLPTRRQVNAMPQPDQDCFIRHGLPYTVRVIKSEEKGSDVNIASYLLLDAFNKDCDAAIVISNDTDLETPIYMARKNLGLRVVCLMPCRAPRRPSMRLVKAASAHKAVDPLALANSQFPPTLTDAIGTFTKPTTW